MALTPFVKKTYAYAAEPTSSVNLNNIQDAIVELQQVVNSHISTISAMQTAIDALTSSIAASYSDAATYAVDDYCIHDYQLYQCTTAIASSESWNGNHWAAVRVLN